MGQQQLFLLVLVVILIGAAVAVGIFMFIAQAASANQMAVSNDLVNLAHRAEQYYIKPPLMGGGGHTFSGMTITHLTLKTTNDNGSYSVISTSNEFAVLEGVGKQDGDGDGVNCTLRATVYPDSIQVVTSNI